DAAYTAAIPLASQNSSQAASEKLASMDTATRLQMQGNQIRSSEQMQRNEINYQTAERALDRSLQEKLASWNLNSSDRDAAARSLLGMEELYNSRLNNIMANPNLSADDRTK